MSNMMNILTILDRGFYILLFCIVMWLGQHRLTNIIYPDRFFASQFDKWLIEFQDRNPDVDVPTKPERRIP